MGCTIVCRYHKRSAHDGEITSRVDNSEGAIRVLETGCVVNRTLISEACFGSWVDTPGTVGSV